MVLQNQDAEELCPIVSPGVALVDSLLYPIQVEGQQIPLQLVAFVVAALHHHRMEEVGDMALWVEDHGN